MANEAPEPDHPTCVTASNLVRNFGEWQDRALGEPVYVLHRGRPRLALVSVDILSRLTRSAALPDAGSGLIEAFDEPVLLFDDEGRLARHNRAAALYFGLSGEKTGFGLSPDRPIEVTIVQLARRVATHRIAERIDAALSPQTDRRVSLNASPVEAGILVVLRDISLREDHARGAAVMEATADALDRHGRLATAHLNQRGHVAFPSLSLARMTGIPPDQLGTTRFAVLFEVGARVAVGDAVEAVLRGGEARTLEAGLLVDGSRRQPVTLSLSPIATRLGVEGAIAILTAAEPVLTEG